MCETCGCSDGAKATIVGRDGTHRHVMPDGSVVTHDHDHDHDHDHRHDHEHDHDHPHSHGHAHAHVQGRGVRTVGTITEALAIKVLDKNDRLAARNRSFLRERRILALNLMSSPGSGKTALLERTLRELGHKVGVLEGDQATSRDAERIAATGTKVVQINTGKGCHLEADMVWHGLEALGPEEGSVLFVENVGNLVCPALFDLGEAAKVVLFSVTEGEDKPLKYPHMFGAADLILLTKTDLVPHLDFDRRAALWNLEQVAPGVPVMELSSRSGAGLSDWYGWIRRRHAAITGEKA